MLDVTFSVALKLNNDEVDVSRDDEIRTIDFFPDVLVRNYLCVFSHIRDDVHVEMHAHVDGVYVDCHGVCDDQSFRDDCDDFRDVFYDVSSFRVFLVDAFGNDLQTIFFHGKLRFPIFFHGNLQIFSSSCNHVFQVKFLCEIGTCHERDYDDDEENDLCAYIFHTLLSFIVNN
jgi:hypothetical protein